MYFDIFRNETVKMLLTKKSIHVSVKVIQDCLGFSIYQNQLKIPRQ